MKSNQSILPLNRKNTRARARSDLVRAIKSTPTLRTPVEITDREAHGGDPDRELELVIEPGHLHNVQPSEQKLQTIRDDTRSIRETEVGIE